MACSNWPTWPPGRNTRAPGSTCVNPASSRRRFDSAPKNSHAARRDPLALAAPFFAPLHTPVLVVRKPSPRVDTECDGGDTKSEN